MSAIGAPKRAVIRSRWIVSSMPRGSYARWSTTVAPSSRVLIVQLLSGEACQIGMEIRNRSSRWRGMVAAVYVAVRAIERCVCTQPLGLPEVPEV